MHEGMEANTTGRDEVFLHGLPTRVKHLESVVDALHRDSLLTQGAISGLSGQVASISETLKDLSNKLDDQRTRKPDMGAVAAWTMAVIAFCGLAFYGVSWRMKAHEESLQLIRDRVAVVEQNRFTKQDGDRLEDRVDKLCPR